MNKKLLTSLLLTSSLLMSTSNHASNQEGAVEATIYLGAQVSNSIILEHTHYTATPSIGLKINNSGTYSGEIIFKTEIDNEDGLRLVNHSFIVSGKYDVVTSEQGSIALGLGMGILRYNVDQENIQHTGIAAGHIEASTELESVNLKLRYDLKALSFTTEEYHVQHELSLGLGYSL